MLFLTLSIFLGVILSIGAILLLEEFTFRRYKKVSELFDPYALRGVGKLRLPPAQRDMENAGAPEVRHLRSKRWEHVEKRGFDKNRPRDRRRKCRNLTQRRDLHSIRSDYNVTRYYCYYNTGLLVCRRGRLRRYDRRGTRLLRNREIESGAIKKYERGY